MKKEILIGLFVLTLFIAGCTNSVDDSSMEKTGKENAVEKSPSNNIGEQMEENEASGATHTVKFVKYSFEPAELRVKVGDTVVWRNDRSSPQLNRAMVLGTKSCTFLKSKLLESGESFEYTFTEPLECTIVDGYITSVFGKVIVEE